MKVCGLVSVNKLVIDRMEDVLTEVDDWTDTWSMRVSLRKQLTVAKQISICESII